MTKMRWAAMGFMLLGAYFVQAIGCSSSPAAPPTSGGACCACTVSDPGTGCSNSKTLKPVATVADCASFCAGQTGALQMCPGAATPTIAGVGVVCPANLAEGGSVVTGAGGSSVVGPDGAMVSVAGFGIACAADTDCGAGLFCLKSSDDIFPGAGYPNGLCTVNCATDPSICAPFNALCAQDPDPNAVNPKSFCVEGCTPGPATASDPKCHNRPDEACEPIDNSLTVFSCTALCTTNADCGTRKCDLGSGLCLDTLPTGDAVGSPCMANAATDSCLGFCRALPGQMPVQGGPAVPGRCSALCVFGNTEGCGWTRNPVSGAGKAVGGCLQPALTGFDVGDVGFCYQLCDAIADCAIREKDWVCDKAPDLITAFNHGACLLEPDPDASTPASDAGGQ